LKECLFLLHQCQQLLAFALVSRLHCGPSQRTEVVEEQSSQTL
jgi:hypothetical protein